MRQDLDGDGDMDVLSASWLDDKIAWYENDGVEYSVPEVFISTNADGAWSVYAQDLDGDGDKDVLSASRDDDKIAWYENDGAGASGLSYSSRRKQMELNPSMPKTWMEMGIWMCSRLRS